jgi:alkanesulfonate monooxygenase SsuD/methylene tetrahydromethanopterin reductase-like flavin-dependent oxidoreductase (luciferase family)
VEVLDRLLRFPATSHAGPHYTIDDSRMIPGCIQQPRVTFAIAAGGPRTLALAARYGDAWITYGDTSYRDLTAAGTEAVVQRQAERLVAECAAAGRDPAELRRIYLIGNTEERPLESVDAFVDFARRYAACGFTDLVFHHPRPGDPVWNEPEEMVERIAAEALPVLRPWNEIPGAAARTKPPSGS